MNRAHVMLWPRLARLGLLVCMLMSALAAFSPPAWALEATVIRSQSEGRISAVQLTNSSFEVNKIKRAGKSYAVVRFQGTFARKDWTLLIEGKKAPTLQRGGVQEFSILVPLSDLKTTVRLHAVSPVGITQEEVITFDFPHYFQFMGEAAPAKTIAWSASLGLTTLSYTETLSPDYGSISSTVKGFFAYRPPREKWDLGANLYLTAMPLTKNLDTTARFLGLNVRVGYPIPGIQSPWRLVLMPGLYFTTMFVSDQSFGFRNMMGPQLFPVLSRTLKNGDVLSSYVKFSPVGEGFRISSLGNSEMAFGVHWTRTLKNGHPLSVGLDIARLSLVQTLSLDVGTETVERDIKISSQSISLSVGYGW